MTSPDTSPRPSGAGHPAERTNIVKVVFASLIGTAVEWYDFFLYGSAAALVFGTLFFPESEPATATLLAFGTYALGFVARPLGGIVFGHFGDRVGRKKMLVTSLLPDGPGDLRHRPAPDVRDASASPPRSCSCCLPPGPGLRRRRRVGRRGADGRRARRRLAARLLVVVAAGRRGAGQPARHRRAVGARGRPVRRRVQRVGLAHPVPAQRRARRSSACGCGSRSRSRRSSPRPRPSSRPQEKPHLPLVEVIKQVPPRGPRGHGHADGGEHLLLPVHDHLDHVPHHSTSAPPTTSRSSSRRCSSVPSCTS